MNKNKSATLTCRIDKEYKDALRIAAKSEHRSLANMIEVLIRDYCKLNNIEIANTAVRAIEIKKGNN